MDKKLKQLFDYQKFMHDDDLQTVIDRCISPSSDKTEADSAQSHKTNGVKKEKIWRCYKRSFITMAGSAAAAVFVLIMNSILAGQGYAGETQTHIGSLFSGGNMGIITAGLILLLGIVVSVIFMKKDK